MYNTYRWLPLLLHVRKGSLLKIVCARNLCACVLMCVRTYIFKVPCTRFISPSLSLHSLSFYFFHIIMMHLNARRKMTFSYSYQDQQFANRERKISQSNKIQIFVAVRQISVTMALMPNCIRLLCFISLAARVV